MEGLSLCLVIFAPRVNICSSNLPNRADCPKFSIHDFSRSQAWVVVVSLSARGLRLDVCHFWKIRQSAHECIGIFTLIWLLRSVALCLGLLLVSATDLQLFASEVWNSNLVFASWVQVAGANCTLLLTGPKSQHDLGNLQTGCHGVKLHTEVNFALSWVWFSWAVSSSADVWAGIYMWVSSISWLWLCSWSVLISVGGCGRRPLAKPASL